MTKIEQKNGHEKDVCNNEIGLCSQYILGVLGSMVNADNWEGLCDYVNTF